MKKKWIFIFIIAGFILFGFALLFMNINNKNADESIEIIDATYACDNVYEEFFSDDDYIYYFPCYKSSSIYVKYTNGNKELVVDALNNNNVTIKDLENAGLKFYKKER